MELKFFQECESAAARKSNDSTSELTDESENIATSSKDEDDISTDDDDEDDLTVLERGKRMATSIGKKTSFVYIQLLMKIEVFLRKLTDMRKWQFWHNLFTQFFFLL